MLGRSGEHKPRALYTGAKGSLLEHTLLRVLDLWQGLKLIFPLQVKQVKGADSRCVDIGVWPPDWRGYLRFVKAHLYI